MGFIKFAFLGAVIGLTIFATRSTANAATKISDMACEIAAANEKAQLEVCAPDSSTVFVRATVADAKKSIVASFDLADVRSVSPTGGRFWRRLWVAEGSAVWTREDRAAVSSLASLPLSHSLTLEQTQAANSLLKFLVGFVPDGTRLEPFDSRTARNRSALNNGGFSMICEFVGYEKDAHYSALGLLKTVNVIVGTGEDRCRGRCGLGCSFFDVPGTRQYTQECLDHDVCHDSTGQQMGDCADEFWAASVGYLLAPDCF